MSVLCRGKNVDNSYKLIHDSRGIESYLESVGVIHSVEEEGNRMTNQLDLAAIRVLVVEDEDFYRGLIIRILEQIGFKDVGEAVDGAQAISKLATFKPDLLVLDLMMEPMNGLNFLKMVRIGMTDAPSDLPVIVLTGSREGALMGTALALDCDAFVQKDGGQDVIRDRIVRVVSTPRMMKSADTYGAVNVPVVNMPPPSSDQATAKTPTSAKAVEVPIYELQPGAVLDQDLTSGEGYLLYAADTALRDVDVSRLQDLSEIIGLQSVMIRQS